MNKTVVFPFLAFLNLMFLNAQDSASSGLMVVYDYSDQNISRLDTLLASEYEMIFLRDNKYNPNQNQTNQKSDVLKNVNANFPLSTVFQRNKSDSILIKMTYPNDKKFIIDIVPNLKWKIHPKFKTILGLKCQMATCSFRGSNITAWYSINIKNNFGPWKFSGLPGLIMEAGNFDSTNFQVWTAKNLLFPYNYKRDIFNLSYNTSDYISYEELVLIRENTLNNHIRRINSRAPAGTTVKSHKLKRNGIEQIFEWETTDEKN